MESQRTEGVVSHSARTHGIDRDHGLLCDGATLRYRDLNSSNGVIHNGAKSKQGTLKAGDELVIGPVVFTIMIDGKPAKITPIRTILDEGASYARQLLVADAADGDLREVVRHLIREFRSGPTLREHLAGTA